MATLLTKTIRHSNIEVVFQEGLSTEEIIYEISGIPNPQIILWYVGPYGLRKHGVHFYRDYLIFPLSKQNLSSTFWLIDLTAWAAFKYPQCSINKKSSCFYKIKTFRNARINCISSSDIFKKMKLIKDSRLIQHFKQSLHRNFIIENSRTATPSQITLGEIFSHDCQIIADWYNSDSAQLYSSLQYLEGCLIAEEIALTQQFEKPDDNIEIIFMLPNDELKYYKDSQNSFQNDFSFLLSTHSAFLNLSNSNIKIRFINFKYEKAISFRPYNAPGEVLKPNALTYFDIAGTICQPTSHFQKEEFQDCQ